MMTSTNQPKDNDMKTLIATAAFSIIAIAAPAGAAQAHSKDWAPCAQEDSTNCVWDAKHMGNGQGHSFKVNKAGKLTYISHRKAHRLLNDNTITPRCPARLADDPRMS